MNLQKFVEQHGQTGAAKLLGVSQGLVWQWLNGRTAVTAERAIGIEEMTHGTVTRVELRPDLFGPPPEFPEPPTPLPPGRSIDPCDATALGLDESSRAAA